jgi:hypothetical protein
MVNVTIDSWPDELAGRRRDALDGAGSPRLVRVREPDQLGVERAHAQLALGVRLVELIAFVVLRELTRLPEQSSSSTPGGSRQHNVDESDEVRVLERGVNQRV